MKPNHKTHALTYIRINQLENKDMFTNVTDLSKQLCLYTKNKNRFHSCLPRELGLKNMHNIYHINVYRLKSEGIPCSQRCKG